MNLVGVSRILVLESRNTQGKRKPATGSPKKGKEGLEIVTDVEGVFPDDFPDDEVPEADAVEQHRAVYFDDEAGLDTAYLNADTIDRDANEADLVEQAFIVPAADDDWDDDH